MVCAILRPLSSCFSEFPRKGKPIPKNGGWQEYRLRIGVGARSQWRLGLSSCHSTVPPQTSYTSWIPFNLKGERAGKSIKTPHKTSVPTELPSIKVQTAGGYNDWGAIQRPDRKKCVCINQRMGVRNWSLLQLDHSRAKDAGNQ